LLFPFNKFTICSYWKLYIFTFSGKKGIGPQCGISLNQGFTESEKLKIVEMHNKLRSKLASGDEKRGQPGPQGPAADMMELVWDDEVVTE